MSKGLKALLDCVSCKAVSFGGVRFSLNSLDTLILKFTGPNVRLTIIFMILFINFVRPTIADPTSHIFHSFIQTINTFPKSIHLESFWKIDKNVFINTFFPFLEIKDL